MNTEHPITPSFELVHRWVVRNPFMRGEELHFQIATQAARWGADQELEACCHEVHDWYGNGSRLRDARRPKSPSLKEQALAELELLRGDANAHGLGFDAPAIRRALEALPDV